MLISWLVIVIVRRSREGAWIEMLYPNDNLNTDHSRSREGAWIEIRTEKKDDDDDWVAPARERGLK